MNNRKHRQKTESKRTGTTARNAEQLDCDTMSAHLPYYRAVFLLDELEHGFPAHDAEPRARILVTALSEVDGLDTPLGHALGRLVLKRFAPSVLVQMTAELEEDAALPDRQDYPLPWLVQQFFQSREHAIASAVPLFGVGQLLDQVGEVEAIIANAVGADSAPGITDAVRDLGGLLHFFIVWRAARQTGPVAA